MKRIHFDNMKNWIWILISILSIVLILIGSFELIEFKNSKIIKRIGAIGFMLFAINSSKMFWYKNYVQWNKKGALIKINSLLGKSLSFIQVQSTLLNDNELIVIKKNGAKVRFDLNTIAASDRQKLNDIFLKNTTKNAGKNLKADHIKSRNLVNES